MAQTGKSKGKTAAKTRRPARLTDLSPKNTRQVKGGATTVGWDLKQNVKA